MHIILSFHWDESKKYMIIIIIINSIIFTLKKEEIENKLKKNTE
jgi:hypothetical protein